jgi:hypothetical protein
MSGFTGRTPADDIKEHYHPPRLLQTHPPCASAKRAMTVLVFFRLILTQEKRHLKEKGSIALPAVFFISSALSLL